VFEVLLWKVDFYLFRVKSQCDKKLLSGQILIKFLSGFKVFDDNLTQWLKKMKQNCKFY